MGIIFISSRCKNIKRKYVQLTKFNVDQKLLQSILMQTGTN